MGPRGGALLRVTEEAAPGVMSFAVQLGFATPTLFTRPAPRLHTNGGRRLFGSLLLKLAADKSLGNNGQPWRARLLPIMSEEEEKLIDRKARELYTLMTGLPEFKTAKFLNELGKEKLFTWQLLVSSLSEWINLNEE